MVVEEDNLDLGAYKYENVVDYLEDYCIFLLPHLKGNLIENHLY